jgi:hypothetical protein
VKPATQVRFALGGSAAPERLRLAEHDGHPGIVLRAGLATIDEDLIRLLNQLVGAGWTGVATPE